MKLCAIFFSSNQNELVLPCKTARNNFLPNQELSDFVRQDEPRRVGQREKEVNKRDRLRVADIVESRDKYCAKHDQVAEATEQKDPEIPGLFEEWKCREERLLSGSQAEK